MNKPDLQALHAVGVEMGELKAAGRWTLEEWERLIEKARVAANGFDELIIPIYRQKPGGLTATIKNGIADLS